MAKVQVILLPFLSFIHCRVMDSKSLNCEKSPKDKKQHKVTLNEVYSAN